VVSDSALGMVQRRVAIFAERVSAGTDEVSHLNVVTNILLDNNRAEGLTFCDVEAFVFDVVHAVLFSRE
jgi:hypothetical protein